MTEQLVVYMTGPLDYWTGMVPLQRLMDNSIEGDIYERRSIDSLPALFDQAKALAADHLLFEGDVSQGPFVAFIPDPQYNQTVSVIGWKQRNNGTTYFASLIALTHLENAADAYVHFSGGKFVRVSKGLW